MKCNFSIALLVVLGVAGFGVIAAEDSKENIPDRVVEFQYRDPVGEKYLTLSIILNGKVVRVLRGDVDAGGAFERPKTPFLSPSGNFVLLVQVEAGEVEMPGNSKVLHEVAYCELVNVNTGCVVARETGEFCGGNFTQDDKWENILYSDFDLVGVAPKVDDYVGRKLIDANTPETSFENLLICDPPSEKNRKAYSELLNLLQSDADPSYFERLKAIINLIFR